MKVGIAGIGKMGAAVGSRLLSLGHDLTVWNRTAARAQPLDPSGMAKGQESISHSWHSWGNSGHHQRDKFSKPGGRFCGWQRWGQFQANRGACLGGQLACR